VTLEFYLTSIFALSASIRGRPLHIAQPPLTQQIKALKAEIGVLLFDRSAYRIKLTAAGNALAAEVDRILGDVRNAVMIAQRVSRGLTRQVRVGFTESASFNPLVTFAFTSFRLTYPDVEVSLEEHPSTELAAALREHRLDAAFLRPPLAARDDLTLHVL
jgi:DNA-binding transcriptional LysR family regulator